MVYQAFTPQVRALRKETDGPLMFANVLGMRAEESTERRNREMWRRTTDNSARVVDEWLPAHQVTTEEVWERTISAGLPYHWCYDSYPGAKDRRGSSRCSCSACTLANHRDLLLTAGRRPRLAELCALVERVRQVPFNPNITMAEVIALSRRRDAPSRLRRPRTSSGWSATSTPPYASRPHGTPRPGPGRASSCTAPPGAMAAADHHTGAHPHPGGILNDDDYDPAHPRPRCGRTGQPRRGPGAAPERGERAVPAGSSGPAPGCGSTSRRAGHRGSDVRRGYRRHAL